MRKLALSYAPQTILGYRKDGRPIRFIGGGDGTVDDGVPTVNEHGYPDNTPTAEMAPEHQAAYWKYQSRKHEARASQAPDAAELEALRAAAAELATHKAAQLSDTERLQAEAAAAKADADAAKAQAAATAADLLRLTVAAKKGLTPEQAARLQGSTQEELEADADALTALFTAPAPPRAVSRVGSDVGAAKTVSAGEERYKARFGSN